MMTIHLRSVARALAAGLVLAAPASAATVVQTFTETFPLTASPTGDLPLIDTVWNVQQFGGYGGLATLTGVEYELTTELYYRGELVSLVNGGSFNLQVRSDFNFDLPGATPDVTSLDPAVSLSGTRSTTPFSLPASGSASASSTASQLASDLVTYVGGGVVPVVVSGSLLTGSPGGGWHNNSDQGVASPYVFVNSAKVFPMFGLQEFSLVATMVVTYQVPETSTIGALGVLGGLTLWHWWSRRRPRP
jgi:hypothetical protein